MKGKKDGKKRSARAPLAPAEFKDPTGRTRIRVVGRGGANLNITNAQGLLVKNAQLVQRAAGGTAARVTTEDGRVFVEGDADVRPTKEADETAAAKRMATAWNGKYGTAYEGEWEPVEGKYWDGYLRSKREGEECIPLQVRWVHDEVIAKFKMGQLGRYELNSLPAVVQAAIDDKKQIDPALAPKTILVLISPVPFGKLASRKLQDAAFDCGSFRAVWLSCFGEDAFPLTSK